MPFAPPPAVLASELGKTPGAYRIDTELGSGGMGKVYLAEAVDRCVVQAGTQVALEVVHPHLLSEPGFFKRFLREAEIGKAVAHPNVVRCHGCDQLVGDATTHAFLVMQYVEGQVPRSRSSAGASARGGPESSSSGAS